LLDLGEAEKIKRSMQPLKLQKFMFNLNETNVARHYDRGGFEYESVRLDRYSPVEFAITSRYLDRDGTPATPDDLAAHNCLALNAYHHS
jgi:hypothetical protein